MIKGMMGPIALSLGLLAGGCAENDLPPGAHVVGGGVQIAWTAPQEGTVMLMDKTTRKTVATKSLNAKGDSFEFDASTEVDRQVLKAAFGGGVPSNARFVLYFIPTPKKS